MMQERKRGGLSGVQRAQVVKETVGWGGVGEAPADGSGMVRGAKRGVRVHRQGEKAEERCEAARP